MMLIRFTLILLGFFTLTASFEVLAQNKIREVRNSSPKLAAVANRDAVKIMPETTTLPEGFRGHDAVVLFKNLDFLVKQNRTTKNTANHKTLDGKAVYGSLTTNNLFAFSDYGLGFDQEIAARNKNDEGLHYFGDLWRLRNINEFPEPELEYVDICVGSGDNGKPLPKVSSREELVTPLTTAKTKAEVWRESTFHLRTEILKTNRHDYKGYLIGERCEEFYVPSLQTHYDLAFVDEQPIPLVNIEDNQFARFHKTFLALENYELQKEYGVGFAVWKGDDVVLVERNLSALFVVKLVSPYVATKTFAKQDPIEKKVHLAVQNKIYVKIVGVWLYNQETGKIVSKNAAF